MTPYQLRVDGGHFVAANCPVQIDRETIAMPQVGAGLFLNQAVLQTRAVGERVAEALHDRMRRLELFAVDEDIAIAKRAQRQIAVDLLDQRHSLEDHEANAAPAEGLGYAPRRLALDQHLQ